jgi:S1-C subfamily serine protease
MKKGLCVLVLLIVSCLVLNLLAQDKPQSKEEVKKRIMERIEKKLKEWCKRVMKRVEEIVDEELEKVFKKPGVKEKGYLGIIVEDTDEGVVVVNVTDNSPAEKAGFKKDDLILSIDEKKIETTDDITEALKNKVPGDEISIKIKRGKRKETIKVTLGRKEKIKPPEKVPGYIGIDVEDAEEGVVITKVEEGSPAHKAGLKKGDIILSIDDAEIVELKDMKEVLAKKYAGDTIEIVVERGDEEKSVRLTLAKREQKKPPAERPPRKKPGYLGIYPRETEEGIEIMSIIEDSPAEKAGLKEGDIIVSIDDQEVEDLEELREILIKKGAGTTVKIKVIRDDEEKVIQVTLGEREDGNPGPCCQEPDEERIRKKIREYMKKGLPKKQEPQEKEAPQEFEERVDELFKYVEELINRENFREYLEFAKEYLKEYNIPFEEIFEEDEEGNLRIKQDIKDALKTFLPVLREVFLETFKEELEKLKQKYEEYKEEIEELFGGNETIQKIFEWLEKFVSGWRAPEKPVPPKKARPYIGFELEELTDEERAEYDLEAGEGILIIGVEKGSPAKRKGIRKGDILLSINDHKVASIECMDKIIEKVKPGDKLKLVILRKGRKKTVKITVGEK